MEFVKEYWIFFFLTAIFLLLYVIWNFPFHRITIEGVYSHKEKDIELFHGTPLTVHYFENYCKRCMESGVHEWRQCNETIPTSIFKFGKEPKPGESAKMTIFVSFFGKMVFMKWSKSDWVPDPNKVKEIHKNTLEKNCGILH